MSQSQGSARRKPRENNFLFDLGKKGRKTGITVPEGVRDEHGMEPLDNIFSSPAKPSSARRTNRNFAARNENLTLSSEEDMDIGQSTIPEPAEVLTARKRTSMRMPPPRSKSPAKTFLQSPARRHPSLGPLSSPLRGSIVSPSRAKAPPSVVRRLDFSVDNLVEYPERTPIRNSPQKRPVQPRSAIKSPAGRLMNGSPSNSRTLEPAFHLNDENLEPLGEDSYQILEADDDVQLGEEEFELSGEVEPEFSPKPSKKRGRAGLGTEVAIKEGKGRAPRKAAIEEPTEEETEEERPSKKPRGNSKQASVKAKSAVAKAQPAKKRDSSLSKISSPVEVQRGPPRPKQSRGLFILRRETPDTGTGFSHTRSGRHVLKPLEYWKGETVVYGDDENADDDVSFMQATIKEVVRATEVDTPENARRKPRNQPKKKRAKPKPEEDEDEDEEPWESEPGRIFGNIRAWNPEDPAGLESDVVDDELALSKAAIITREIPNQTFRFAKTLTLPFFGSGMVDLPPGAIKRPKNTRRMQMVFVVLTGRVCVTVNDTEFRIGVGGMWQVPRGNFYSIENDYDKEARIFFAQGCEVWQESIEMEG